MKSKKIEPLRHLSNLSKVIESSFKNDQTKIDEILPKMKFPLPNDLRNIDNVVYENYKDSDEHKFLTWDSKKKALNKMNSQGSKKIQEMKKELDELNEIARNKYGINIPKQELTKEEKDPKNLLFKLQPEFLNSKIINYDNNSLENYKSSTISQHKNTVSLHENQKSLNGEEKMEDSSVPEFLLQNVFLANKEMKNFRIGHSQTQVKQQRAFKSQNSMRNPYKSKGQFNFASTFSGNFKK